MTKVLALAGGVGGAKLVWGFSQVLRKDFSVIVNTGDDFVHYGLNISPDLDTVMYTLAGVSNPVTGWGRNNETWNCLDAIKEIDGETWFALGDRDLATHMIRTKLLNKGLTLTEVTEWLSRKLKIHTPILPMTDQLVTTVVNTEEFGEIPFQEYFVKYHFEPRMINCYYKNIEKAKLSVNARQYLEEAEIIIFCPSNPWLSIMPILAVKDVVSLIKKKTCIAVSPIIGHDALKGPAAKIFNEMGIVPSGYEVARLYKNIINGFVLDKRNVDEKEDIEAMGIISLVTDTIMNDGSNKIRLAKDIIDFVTKSNKGK
jgi:LPPG:FO 2-phospho-L-lactate transferase